MKRLTRCAVLIAACLVASQCHAQFLIQKGKTSITRYVLLTDSTTHAPKTGYAVTSIKMQYTRNRAAPSTVATATALSTNADAWMNGSATTGKAIEVDATSSPGVFRIDWPDAAFVSGVNKVILTISGTGIDPAVEEIQLIDFDPEEPYRLGMLAFPGVAPGNLNALPTVGTGTAQISLSGGRTKADVELWNGFPVPTSTIDGVPETHDISRAAPIIQTTVSSVTNQTNLILTIGSPTDDDYNDQVVTITRAANVLQKVVRQCNDYTGGTKSLNISAAASWTVVAGDIITITPAATQLTTLTSRLTNTRATLLDSLNNLVDIYTAFEFGGGSFRLTSNGLVNTPAPPPEYVSDSGTTGGSPFSTTTLKLRAGAPATDNYFRYQILALTGGTGAGQSSIIASYVGSTKVATIVDAWLITPDATTQYKIKPYGRINPTPLLASDVVTAMEAGGTKLTLIKTTVDLMYILLTGGNTFAEELAAAGGTPERLAKLDAPLLDVSASAATNFDRSARSIVRGTCSGTPTVSNIPTTGLTPAATTANQFTDRVILFDNLTTTAALRGQGCRIISNTSGGVFTVTPLTTAPVSGDTFTIN